ncbi:hypothetical protein PsYK624_140720, partial [Phanerochaete sordida]
MIGFAAVCVLSPGRERAHAAAPGGGAHGHAVAGRCSARGAQAAHAAGSVTAVLHRDPRGAARAAPGGRKSRSVRAVRGRCAAQPGPGPRGCALPSAATLVRARALLVCAAGGRRGRLFARRVQGRAGVLVSLRGHAPLRWAGAPVRLGDAMSGCPARPVAPACRAQSASEMQMRQRPGQQQRPCAAYVSPLHAARHDAPRAPPQKPAKQQKQPGTAPPQRLSARGRCSSPLGRTPAREPRPPPRPRTRRRAPGPPPPPPPP